MQISYQPTSLCPQNTAVRLISAFSKRLLRLLLVFTLPVAVQAQYNYLVDNRTITVTEGSCSNGAAAIPDTVDGLPVTSIGYHAFSGCTSLTCVTIGNGVTSIGGGRSLAAPALPASRSATG